MHTRTRTRTRSAGSVHALTQEVHEGLLLQEQTVLV